MNDDLTGSTYKYHQDAWRKFVRPSEFFKGAVIALILSLPVWGFLAYIIWRW